MPQVDLETLVSACAGGGAHDRKIACEQALGDGGGDHPPEDESREVTEQPEIPPEVPPDVPPESFWLSKDAEYDWLDQNAFYERKDSTKGSSNSTNLNPCVNPPPPPNSNSQRFSFNFKSKASILGLPKLHFADAKNRRNSNSGNGRLFPTQSGSTQKSDSALVEPSSPKVSCMGRVRSKRDRSRRRLKNRHPTSEPPPPPPAPEEKPDRNVAKRGFLSILRSLFKGWKKPPPVKPASPVAEEFPLPLPAIRASDKMTSNIDALTAESHPRRSVGIEPPGLGGVKRFSSGRRSGSWVVGDGE